MSILPYNVQFYTIKKNEYLYVKTLTDSQLYNTKQSMFNKKSYIYLNNN